jgi:phosphoenolpyruvate carboxykinase (ATP)
LLGERIAHHKASCWLVNTGWSGGPYGVGKRMAIEHTRAMVNAALDGSLADVEYDVEPFFGLAIPRSVPGVPGGVLNPRNAWSDAAAYDAQARKLAGLFAANFERFAGQVSPAVQAVAIKP